MSAAIAHLDLVKHDRDCWSHRGGSKPEGLTASLRAPQRGTRSDDPSPSSARGLVKAAYLSVFDDGRAVELQLPGLPPMKELTRGDIEGMSDESRRRLLAVMHRIRRDAPLPVMLTVTFPEELTVTGAEAKACYRALAKRIERGNVRWSALWRLEAHPEMSKRLGRMHPHLHLLCWNVWFDLAWLSEAWADVVWTVLEVDKGMTDVREKLVKAGTSAERVRKWAGVAYVVKAYMAKGEEYPLGKSGRVWGWWKGERLPLAKATRVELTNLQVVTIKRRVWEWMAVKRIKSEHMIRTIFCDDPTAFAAALLVPSSWQREKEYHDSGRNISKA